MSRARKTITDDNCHLVGASWSECLNCPLLDCVDVPWGGSPLARCPIDGHGASWQSEARTLYRLSKVVEASPPMPIYKLAKAGGSNRTTLAHWARAGRIETDQINGKRVVVGVNWGDYE